MYRHNTVRYAGGYLRQLEYRPITQSTVDDSLQFFLWLGSLREQNWRDLYPDQPDFVAYLEQKRRGNPDSACMWHNIGGPDHAKIRAYYRRGYGETGPVDTAAEFHNYLYGCLGIVECWEAFGRDPGEELFTVFDSLHRDTVRFYAELTHIQRGQLVNWFNNFQIRNTQKYNMQMFEEFEGENGVDYLSTLFRPTP